MRSRGQEVPEVRRNYVADGSTSTGTDITRTASVGNNLKLEVAKAGPAADDRMILAALGSGLPPGRLLFSPATLLGWHRELVRRHWAAFGSRPMNLRERDRPVGFGAKIN